MYGTKPVIPRCSTAWKWALCSRSSICPRRPPAPLHPTASPVYALRASHLQGTAQRPRLLPLEGHTELAPAALKSPPHTTRHQKAMQQYSVLRPLSAPVPDKAMAALQSDAPPFAQSQRSQSQSQRRNFASFGMSLGGGGTSSIVPEVCPPSARRCREVLLNAKPVGASAE